MVIITEEQVAGFHRDGYVVVDDLLSRPAVENLRAAHDELLRRWASECSCSIDDYTRVVSQWTGLWKQHPAFHGHIHRPALAAIARRLLGATHVQLFHDHLISKPPRHSATIPWHQDYPFWPIDKPRALSCWVALDDATAASGALRFMPGAHHRGEQPPIDFLRANKQWGPAEAMAVDVEVRAGSAIIHDCLSWHMSPPNTTAAQRRAIITIVMDSECRWHKARSSWHPMNAYVSVADGECFNGDEFPLIGAASGES